MLQPNLACVLGVGTSINLMLLAGCLKTELDVSEVGVTRYTYSSSSLVVKERHPLSDFFLAVLYHA
jgi:hypothetical protein